jgi:hypothetical protein
VKLELLKTFGTIFEAESAKKRLESEGIKAIFQTTLPGGTGQFGNIGGGELYVRSEDLAKAQAILE